jgi:hypothetical protein
MNTAIQVGTIIRDTANATDPTILERLYIGGNNIGLADATVLMKLKQSVS